MTGAHRLTFDLERPGTWAGIPVKGDILWSFPATPLAAVKQCAAALGVSSRRLVVLASTSAYDVGQSDAYPPPWTDELSPIDRSKPRVAGEEFLREECGAVVLRIAGIYGPGRNPLDWLRTGRIGRSRKYVNLIHVEDLARICLAALQLARRGDVYNVSDGRPKTWEEICIYASARWQVVPRAGEQVREPGKWIASKKIAQSLGTMIQHENLFDALDAIERGSLAHQPDYGQTHE